MKYVKSAFLTFIIFTILVAHASERKPTPSPSPLEQVEIFKEKGLLPPTTNTKVSTRKTLETKEFKEEAENPTVLLMDRSKTLGVKISLPKELQKPLTVKNYNQKQLIEYALTFGESSEKKSDTKAETESVSADSESSKSSSTHSLAYMEMEEDALLNPLYSFDFCDCIPGKYRAEFSAVAAKEAVTLYKNNQGKPFVYTSFASGELLPDLNFLTKLSLELEKAGISEKRLRINLVDTDYRGYLKALVSSKKQTSISWDFEPSPEVTKILKVDLGSNGYNWIQATYKETTFRLSQFLRWLEYNLGFKPELYIYGTAQELIKDHADNKIPSNNLIVAQDYYDIAEGDLAQLLARTLILNGIFVSLNNYKRSFGLQQALYSKEQALLEKTQEFLTQELSKQGPAWWKRSNILNTRHQTIENDNINLIVSKKKREIPTQLFKDLLAQIRVDNLRLGRLFTPLFYAEQEKQQYFAYEQAKKTIGFNVLKYFEIVTSNYIEYTDPDRKEEKEITENSDQAFNNALYALDVIKVKKLIKLGADVNKEDEYGATPLRRIASVSYAEPFLKAKQLEMIELLLTLGADIDHKDKNGYTALSSFGTNYDVAKFLLEKGANPNTKDIMPLIEAVRNGDVKLIELLIHHGADLNAFDQNENSPLLQAVQDKKYDLAKLLLERGADAKKDPRLMLSAMAIAMTTGNSEFTKLLADYGAPTSISISK